MKLTLLFSNAASFRGSETMDFWKYWDHHLSLSPSDNKERLEEMVALVKDTNADIVGLAEVDRCAHWSKRVNQPKYLAERLGYDYLYGGNYGSPLPMIYTADTGNAVLSKFRVLRALSGKRHFTRRNLYELVTAPFGAKEFVHTVHYLPNSRLLHVVCTHLSTNFRRLRENNARDLCEFFAKNILPFHRECGHSYILMGDLNTVPLFTEQKHGFSDNYVDLASRLFPDDYRRDYTLNILKHSGLFKSTMALDPFNQDLVDISPELYGTYPQKPNRMIDYIFVSPNVQTSDVKTVHVGFSDHRAILTTVEIAD